MKYRMTKEKRATLKNFGRWRAVAVHEQTVETQQIVKEVCRRTGASRGSVVAVLAELSAVVCEHLRRGDRVRIDDFGLLKLEIEGDKVDSAEEFDTEKHIRGVRLHVLAESRHGRQALYSAISFEKIGVSFPPQPPHGHVSPHRAAGSLFCAAQTSWKDISRAQSCSQPAPRVCPGKESFLQTADRRGP